MPLTGQAKRDYQLAWIQRRRDDWIAENGPCARCGSQEDLQVDHIDPATKSMNPARIWSLSAAKREAELVKCQVLCGACHREKTQVELSFIPEHGTRARYARKDEYKCRCPLCRAANAEYEARRRHALA